ncbi:MAG: hemerythrin domain-containing protein [Bacteroidia bacterium]
MSLTLAELAIHIPASIVLFEKYGLDYYQCGQRVFEEVCLQEGLSHEELEKEMSRLQSEMQTAYPVTLAEMDIGGLIDFLNGQYHSDEKQALSEIHSQIRQLLDGDLPENIKVSLTEIEKNFLLLSRKLLEHCHKEDLVIFPYMRRLSELRRKKMPVLAYPELALIRNPLSILEDENEDTLRILAGIKNTAKGFLSPPDASGEYMQLMVSFKEFERDLHIHLHIENNILFPRVKELLKELQEGLDTRS